MYGSIQLADIINKIIKTDSRLYGLTTWTKYIKLDKYILASFTNISSLYCKK